MKENNEKIFIEQEIEGKKFRINMPDSVDPETFKATFGKKKAVNSPSCENNNSNRAKMIETRDEAFNKVQDTLFGIKALGTLFGDQHNSQEIKLDEWDSCGIGSILRCLYDQANENLSTCNHYSIRLSDE